jgi:hypothetical protein
MIEAKYVVIIILTNVAAAFWFGIIFERANWNKLNPGRRPTQAKEFEIILNFRLTAGDQSGRT